MLKKSLSDLSTTIYSVKDSNISKNESDNEKIEISALITSYRIVEDSKKFFKKNYALFEIKLLTPYKIWIIHKRYSQFAQLKKELELQGAENLPPLPKKYIFLNEEKLNERKLNLEEFLNELIKSVNIIKYPLIIEFLECPKDVVDIIKLNFDCLTSSLIKNNTINNNNYYNGRISTNKNNLYNYNEINSNNFYSSVAEFKLNNNMKEYMDNEDFYEDEISPGTLAIQEFLRNLMVALYNKTELIFQFEFFLKNTKNPEKNLNCNNWFYLSDNEIEIFLEGFYSNISHAKINGFLYHCGNIQKNKLGAQKCLEFLAKMLNEDFNPQADIFKKIFKRCRIENIVQMELESHIIDNSNSNRNNAFIILYKFVGKKNVEAKIKRILMHQEAEKLFMDWFENQDFYL